MSRGDSNRSRPLPITPAGADKTPSRNRVANELSIYEGRKTPTNHEQKAMKKVLTSQGLMDSGLVKRRIGAFEQIFIQNDPSEKQVSDTAAKAREMAALLELTNPDKGEYSPEEIQAFLDSCKVAEPFAIGDTHIYNVGLLQPNVSEYLRTQALMNMNNKEFPLSCGVYGDRAKKPPVIVTAVAVRTNEAPTPTMYVALTINALPGHELDPEAYGLRQIAITSKDFEDNVLEKLVDILPSSDPNAIIGYEDDGGAGDRNSMFISPSSNMGAYPLSPTDSPEDTLFTRLNGEEKKDRLSKVSNK